MSSGPQRQQQQQQAQAMPMQEAIPQSQDEGSSGMLSSRANQGNGYYPDQNESMSNSSRGRSMQPSNMYGNTQPSSNSQNNYIQSDQQQNGTNGYMQQPNNLMQNGTNGYMQQPNNNDMMQNGSGGYMQQPNNNNMQQNRGSGGYMQQPNNNNNRTMQNNYGNEYNMQPNMQQINPDGQQYTDEEGAENLQAAFAKSVCHDMNPCDMLTALVCPCITYGEVVESLQPEPSDSQMTTACMVWTGVVAISAAAIEVPLLVPGACSWLPTTYLGGVMDARQLLLAFSYFVPHCICHIPLRNALLGPQENVVTTCVNSVLCSCCSLGSMKVLAKDVNMTFDDKESELGKWMPFAATLYPRERANEQAPLTQNSMQNEPFIPRTGSLFRPEFVHFYD